MRPATLLLLLVLGCSKSQPVRPQCPQPTPPDPPLNLVAQPGPGTVNLQWSNPPGGTFEGVRLLRRVRIPPQSPEDTSAVLVYQGSGTAATDACLMADSVYAYSAWSYDGCEPPLFSSGFPSTSAVPTQPQPPAPPTNLRLDPRAHSFIISWVPPPNVCSPTFIVRRGETDYPASASDGDSVFTGPGTFCVDDSLSPIRTYFYSVYSRDSHGQVSGAPAQASGRPDWEYAYFDIPELFVVERYPIYLCGPGDCDFARHGPDVELVVELKRNSLLTFWVEVTLFKAMETASDFTCRQKSAEIWSSGTFTGSMGEGWIFDGYPDLPAVTERIHYVDTDISIDRIPGFHIVEYADVVGDTNEGDVCGETEDDTHLHLLRTRPIRVRVKR